jgi:hypothetical protein
MFAYYKGVYSYFCNDKWLDMSHLEGIIHCHTRGDYIYAIMDGKLMGGKVNEPLEDIGSHGIELMSIIKMTSFYGEVMFLSKQNVYNLHYGSYLRYFVKDTEDIRIICINDHGNSIVFRRGEKYYTASHINNWKLEPENKFIFYISGKKYSLNEGILYCIDEKCNKEQVPYTMLDDNIIVQKDDYRVMITPQKHIVYIIKKQNIVGVEYDDLNMIISFDDGEQYVCDVNDPAIFAPADGVTLNYRQIKSARKV